MDFETVAMDHYRVEVSGWERAENFFVEKTMLDWNQEGKKDIALRAEVREGSVLFVRLLQTSVDVNNIPIAYQAVKIASKDPNGRTRLWLEGLHPRSESPRLEDHDVKDVDTVRVSARPPTTSATVAASSASAPKLKQKRSSPSE